VFNDRTLFLDIESHSATERRMMPSADFLTIGGYSWGEDPQVTILGDYNELMEVIRYAHTVVAHNGHAFDFDALFPPEEALGLALEHRLFDTMIHATLAMPAPFGWYTDYKGTSRVCKKPPEFRRWYKLDNLCHQLGIEGKHFDLVKYANQFLYRQVPTYSEKTGKLLKATRREPVQGICCAFSAIPKDDPEFREYLVQDVRCLRELTRELVKLHPVNRYAWFEQEKAAVAVQVGRTGIRGDTPVITQRIRDQHEEAAWILDGLRTRHGFPVSGKSPMTTKSGKAAVAAALESVGVLHDALGTTDKGNPSYSGDSLLAATASVGTPEAVSLGTALATLAGQRSLAETARDHLDSQGFAHPQIIALQRSGRFSTTDPGLTIWDPSHKNYWVADNDDELLVEFDYSNADARAVAAMSGDTEFAKRFLPGMDGHLINAHLLWGEDVVGWDKKDPVTARYRQAAKAPGHGIGYNMGADLMADNTGLSLAECKRFIANYRARYSGVTAWQARVVAEARTRGYVMSDWGRRMPVQRGRETTQAPGLLGQNATHELLCMGLIRLPIRNLKQIKVTIHDAVLASIPKESLEGDIHIIESALSTRWHPRGGQEVEFPLGHGTPARDWKSAAH
jgi:DNA polymerase-1